MIIEGWMASVGISLIIAIAGYAVVRYRVDVHGTKLNELDKRSDAHYRDINILKEQHKAHERYSDLHSKHVDEKMSDIKELINDKIDAITKTLERMEKSWTNR